MRADDNRFVSVDPVVHGHHALDVLSGRVRHEVGDPEAKESPQPTADGVVGHDPLSLQSKRLEFAAFSYKFGFGSLRTLTTLRLSRGFCLQYTLQTGFGL